MPSDGKYFQTSKRGEIHELKEELHIADKGRKKEAVKKARRACLARNIWMYFFWQSLQDRVFMRVTQNNSGFACGCGFQLRPGSSPAMLPPGGASLRSGAERPDGGATLAVAVMTPGKNSVKRHKAPFTVRVKSSAKNATHV